MLKFNKTDLDNQLALALNQISVQENIDLDAATTNEQRIQITAEAWKKRTKQQALYEWSLKGIAEV